MGFLERAYEWVDERLGGVLPGGYVPAGRTIEEQQLAQAQAEAQLPAARAQLAAVQAGAPAVIAPAGFPALGGIVQPGGVPAVAAPRGRIVTLVARIMPGGQIVPIRQYQGRPALMSSDMTAARRVKRIGQQVAKMFPKRRRASAPRYRAQRARRRSSSSASSSSS